METTMTCIAGYAREKKELEKLIHILRDRETYQKKGAKLPKGIVFYGPTGTGKSLFARVLAGACELPVHPIDLGQAENDAGAYAQIKAAFDAAAAEPGPCMILFEEMDKVLPDLRDDCISDRSKGILAQLLTRIDGMRSGACIFVATCNRYASLPPALVRAGRIDRKIILENPNESSRLSLLEMYFSKTVCQTEIPLPDMAKITVGFSCAAIETLVNECVLCSDDRGMVSRAVIQEKIQAQKEECLPKKDSDLTKRILAARAVGRLLVGRAYETGDFLLTLDAACMPSSFFRDVLSEIGGGGWDEEEEEDGDEETYYYSRQDYGALFSVIYGGLIAEKLLFGENYDGHAALLSLIEEGFLLMVGCGMFGHTLLYYVNSDLPYPQEKCEQLFSVYSEMTDQCYARAERILLNNRDTLARLSADLAERGIITAHEGEALLAAYGFVAD